MQWHSSESMHRRAKKGPTGLTGAYLVAWSMLHPVRNRRSCLKRMSQAKLWEEECHGGGICPRGGIPKHAILPPYGLDQPSGDRRVPEARVNGSALAQSRLRGNGRNWLGGPCLGPLLVFFINFFRIVNLMLHSGAQTA